MTAPNQAEADWEYYTTHVPVQQQISKQVFMQLPPGRLHQEQRDRWYEENLAEQHEAFNCRNFPTPPTWLNKDLSYTSKIYDYPRK